MEKYELKFYGPSSETGAPNAVLGIYSFSMANNLLAIDLAKSAFSEAVAGCVHAILRHERQGVIWEEVRPAPEVGGRDVILAAPAAACPPD